MKDFNQVRGNLLEMLEDLDLQLENVSDDDKVSQSEKSKLEDSSAGNEKDGDLLDEKVIIDMEKVKQVISDIDEDTLAICLKCGRPIKRLDNGASDINQCKFCVEKFDDE